MKSAAFRLPHIILAVAAALTIIFTSANAAQSSKVRALDCRMVTSKPVIISSDYAQETTLVTVRRGPDACDYVILTHIKEHNKYRLSVRKTIRRQCNNISIISLERIDILTNGKQEVHDTPKERYLVSEDDLAAADDYVCRRK